MRKEPLTIELDPDSELARALEKADEDPVLLNSNGVRFRVSRVTDTGRPDYDPARLRAALREAAGVLTPEEGERLKALIYRGREEGTRPIDRP